MDYGSYNLCWIFITQDPQVSSFLLKPNFLQLEPLVSKIPEEEANDEDGDDGVEGEVDNDDEDEETLLDLDMDEV